MTPFHAVIGFTIVQRLAELVLARRNHRALAARGAIEFGQRHYGPMVVLHAGWLAALLLTVDPATPVSLPLLAVFVACQLGRAWVVRTLGPLWTTRVMVMPGAARVQHGPYRCLDHPNYWIVLVEVAVVPLMFGAWQLALLASVPNALILRARMRAENEALAEVYGPRLPAPAGAASSASD